MEKALTRFIKAWIVLAFLVNVAAIVGFFVGAPTIRDGWEHIAETYGPFNLVNLLAEVLLLSPAIAAMYWRDRRRTKE